MAHSPPHGGDSGVVIRPGGLSPIQGGCRKPGEGRGSPRTRTRLAYRLTSFNTNIAEAREYFPIVQDRVCRRQFNSLFLFVTSRCNSLCRTCFFFDKLNSKDDPTNEEIARTSETAPPFRKLWISGGDPFLREGLAEIVAGFVRRNGVRNVNLPTNGLLPEKIFP